MQMGIAILRIVTGDPLLIQLKARCVTLSLKSSFPHQLAVYAVWDRASSLPEEWHSLTIGVYEGRCWMFTGLWDHHFQTYLISFWDEGEIKFCFIALKH